MVRMFSAVIVVLTLTLTAIPSPAIGGDRVVARVGTSPITYMEVRSLQAEGQGIPFSEALRMIIDQTLAYQWAMDNQIRVSNAEIDDVITSLQESNNLTPDQFQQALKQQGMTVEGFRKRIGEQMTASRAISVAIRDRIKLDDDLLKKMYEEQYKPTQSYTLRHIFFIVDKDAEEEEKTRIFEEAEVLLDDIRAGLPFEQAARERSDDSTTANRGGDLGTYSQGELLPELDAVAVQLEAGDIDGPIETSAGYHIIQVTSKEMVPPPPFEEVREDLIRKWNEEERTSEVQKWLKELEEIYYVEIFPDDG